MLQKQVGEQGEAGKLLLCGQPEHLVDGIVLGEDISLGNPLDLAFTEHMHHFIPLNRPLCRVKGSKPQAEIHQAFHPTMILFYHIIQILALSEPTGLWERSVVLEGLKRQGIGGVLVDGNDPRGARMRGLKHLAEGKRSRGH